MNFLRHIRATPLLLLSFVPAATGSAAAPETDAWTLAERFDFNAALSALSSAGSSATAGERLALAAARLAAQPRTPDNIARSLSEARALAADPATPPDLRLAAAFLEGRILREHLEPRTPENLAASRAVFQKLVDSGAEHPLALRATVSLAFALLDDDPSRPAAERVAAAEALIPRAAARPAVERDLRYVIAQAALRWRLDPAIARDHLRRVDEIGFAQLPRRLSVRVSLGRVAEESSEPALAVLAYRAFLAEAVRDHREPTIRARLAVLEPLLAPAGSEAAPAAASPHATPPRP